MKKLFQLMLAAILTLSGTLAGLTSCSDNEDNATPQKSVVGDLEGQWSVNLSKQLNVDFAFLTFNFTKDNQLELGLTTYNYNSDSYEQTYIRGMVAKLADKEYDNRMVQRIEMTFDEATKQVLGISGDDASARGCSMLPMAMSLSASTSPTILALPHVRMLISLEASKLIQDVAA